MAVLAILGALAVASLFVLILGVMREVVIMRGEVTALSQLITDPPPPSFLGQRLPDALSRRLAPPEANTSGTPGTWVVAFLSPGCASCKSVLDDVAAAVEDGTLKRGDVRFVVT